MGFQETSDRQLMNAGAGIIGLIHQGSSYVLVPYSKSVRNLFSGGPWLIGRTQAWRAKSLRSNPRYLQLKILRWTVV